MSGKWDRRARGILVVAVACAVVGAGCGSRLDRARLERTLGSVEGLRPAAAAPGSLPAAGPAPAAAGPAAGGGVTGTNTGGGGTAALIPSAVSGSGSPAPGNPGRPALGASG